MASAIIGALRVTLGMDSAAFEKGLRGTQSKLASFGKFAAKGMMVVGAAAAAAAAGVTKSVSTTIDAADEMSKAAQKIGIPIDELSRLKYAADLSGVAFGGLQNAVKRMSANMSDAAQGTGEAKDAFEALKISVTNQDGTLKSASAVMAEMAAKFALMPDGAQKTALAMDIMGKSGADMIPMLNGGTDALNKLLSEAETFGQVFTQQMGTSAEAFNDNLSRIRGAGAALSAQITQKILPTLERLSEWFVTLAKDGDKVTAMANGIESAFQFVAREVAQLSILIGRLRAEFAGLSEAFSRLGNGDFSGAWASFQAGQEESVKMAEAMNNKLQDAFGGGPMDLNSALNKLPANFGEAGEKAAGEFVVKFEKKTREGAGKASLALKEMAREAANVFDRTRTPLEKYNAEIEKLTKLLNAGKISQDTFNRAVIQAKEDLDDASESTRKMDAFFSTIGDSIKGLISGTKGWKDVLSDVIGKLTDALFSADTLKNLFGGFGGGSSGGGLGGLFSGLLGGLFGFADGGSFNVGGSGGIDSQIVAFKASPNENVSVTKPGQTAGGGGQTQVVIRVVPDKEGFHAFMVDTADGQIKQAAPALVSGSAAQVNKQLSGMLGNYQRRKG